ncbi:hypothetical protein [Endozoicomonas sp. ALE010]|uniref:hypothetical protein n=1 Tax=Endozoicomonas sp. ALE010 TaxID=3403081 RepID=UPI003BB745C0
MGEVNHNFQVTQVMQHQHWRIGLDLDLDMVVHQFTTDDAVKRCSQLGVLMLSFCFIDTVPGQIESGGDGVQITFGNRPAFVKNRFGAIIVILCKK